MEVGKGVEERVWGKDLQGKQSWKDNGAAWDLDALVQETLNSPLQQQSYTLPRLLW